LQNAQLWGADLLSAELQGADLRDAQLQGANLRDASIGSANVKNANLTWSDLRGLSQSPLDRETYEGLEKVLTDATRDKSARTEILDQIQAAVGRPTNLSAAHSDERSVLCDNVELFRFCVTQVQSAEYADHRAMFLGTLVCEGKDAAIARGITLWHQSFLEMPGEQKDPILMAFVKHVTTIPEKDCPGWAALPAAQKDTLRKLAAEKTSVR
jgi:Pentapeptide repeats (8 copies)